MAITAQRLDCQLFYGASNNITMDRFWCVSCDEHAYDGGLALWA